MVFDMLEIIIGFFIGTVFSAIAFVFIMAMLMIDTNEPQKYKEE